MWLRLFFIPSEWRISPPHSSFFFQSLWDDSGTGSAVSKQLAGLRIVSRNKAVADKLAGAKRTEAA
jgi:hypothetical protein